MLPIRHSNIFRSRWTALLWAAGMIWFALDVAGSQSSDPAPDAAPAATTAAASLPADQQEALNTLANFGK